MTLFYLGASILFVLSGLMHYLQYRKNRALFAEITPYREEYERELKWIRAAESLWPAPDKLLGEEGFAAYEGAFGYKEDNWRYVPCSKKGLTTEDQTRVDEKINSYVRPDPAKVRMADAAFLARIKVHRRNMSELTQIILQEETALGKIGPLHL